MLSKYIIIIIILQWGSTMKVSTELPVATRHRRDMTEKMLKATLNQNNQTSKQTSKQTNKQATMYFTV